MMDPITLELVRHAVHSVAEEMRTVLMRSARAPLLKEAGDLSCALTDASGRLVAQGRDIPIHLGVMAFTVKEFLRRVSKEELEPGDVWFTNLPEVGGNHLPDVKAITPVFYGGRLVAFAVNLAHWPDVGGAHPGSYVAWARDSFGEGLRIAPVPLFRNWKPQRHLLDLVLSNVRNPKQREGDILAQMATNYVANARLVEVFERFGMGTVLECFERFMEESERQIRSAIAELPPGVYSGTDIMDDDGTNSGPFTVHVRIHVEKDRLHFDFGGTSPQARGPINATFYVTASAVYYAVIALLCPEVSVNDGCYRPVSLHIPPGSLLNAAPTAPVVGGNHETSQRVVDAIFRALAPVLPDRVTAGGSNTTAVLIFSGRWEGEPFVFYELHAGGEGASARRDGTNAVRVHLSNTMNTPVEVIEAEYPLRVECCELIPNSGGLGRYRGGLGMRRAYRFLASEGTLTTMVERAIYRPWGLFGGLDGAGANVWLIRDGQKMRLPNKANLPLYYNDLVIIESAGGGGYGPYSERPEEARLQDKLEGYVVDEA
jgi:N-methylhydantoinase B